MTGCSLLLALGWAATAAPAPIPLRIEFEAPSGCSSAESFYAGVRARTDRVRRAEATETGVHLRVRLTRRTTDVHGELRGFDERGETETRSVNGESCEEVVEALSLTAALALDPNARFAPSAAPPTPEDTASPESGPPPSAQPPETELEESSVEAQKLEEAEASDRAEAAALEDAAGAGVFAEIGAQTMGMNVLASNLSLGGAVFFRVGFASRWFSPRSWTLMR